MKTRHILTLSLAAAVSAAMAYDVIRLESKNVFSELTPEAVNEISLSADKAEVLVSTKSGESVAIPRTSLVGITFGTADGAARVIWNQAGAWVYNPAPLDGVEAQVDGGHVVITANSGKPLEIRLSGSVADGQFKIYGSDDVSILLDGVDITNSTGNAINIQSTGNAVIKVVGENSLVDAAKYTTPKGEKEKGTIYAVGNLELQGTGSLNLIGNSKHAVCAEGSITVTDGVYNVNSAASDAFHGVGIVVNGGSITTLGTVGDALDADTGTIAINGGTLDLTLPTADTKAIKGDGEVALNGGNITLNISGDQCKGIKSKADVRIAGASIKAIASGNAVVVDGDPSYCSVVKTDMDFIMTDGSLDFKTSGKGGKGISADGNCSISGGTLVIECTGVGEQYTDVNGANDVYSSTCITIDGNATLTGGKFTLTNSGSAGKCLKVDGSLTLGDEVSGPEITAAALGVRINEGSSSSTGGTTRPNRPGGGGGWEQGGNYSNPKAVKANGNLVVNNGTYYLRTANNGGEGLESKANLTINGGHIDIDAYDDAINAANVLTINGGVIRAISSYNDGIDSNGSFTINGGVIICESSATQNAEEAFDCDNVSIKINGGYLFGIGSNFMSSFSATQPALKYTGAATKDQLIVIAGADGNVIAVTPTKSFSSGKMLISSPDLKANTSYTIYKGGSIDHGTEYYNMVVGGSYTPGTQASTYTQGSGLTTVGSSSSRPW